jgi:putative copper export protein
MANSVLLFSAKYIFRTLHMGSFGLIFGNLIYDYLFGKRVDTISADFKKPFTSLSIIAGIVLMLSGLVNMIILVIENKYNKNSAYEFWKKSLIAKFFLTLSLTPLLDLVIADKSICFNVRVAIVVALFSISPFLRYFRENFLKSQKKEEKIEEYELIKKNNKD